ncbi:MAG: HAD-IA family hydrolase [Pseudomonadota bacterium]|nr:HAD-IA family hydrolase [Pseudomonadota bacterium]
MSLLLGRRVPLGLVIFDCDGVLIDSEPVCNRVVAEELSAIGWPLTAFEAQRQFVGMSFYDLRVAAERRLGNALPERWIDQVVARVAAVLADEVETVSGAREALAAADALGLDWRIASNSGHVELAAKFKRTGLAGVVSGRLHSADDAIAEGGRGKPAPDLFLRAARSAGRMPAECLVIEDSVLGARAARAAAMDCLGYCPHDDGTALAAEGAVPLGSLHDLPELFRAALGAGA